MTQPVQEPTLNRTDSRLSWGQNQLQRRPGITAGALQLPYPPRYPRVAITSRAEEQRYWPGGVIVVPAYAWRTNGSLASGAADSIFANNGVSHDQSAASFAAADSTLEFNPVDDIGLPSDVWYQVQIGFQIRGTGTNVQIRSSPKPADAAGSDAGYPGVLFLTGIVHDYFGIGRFEYAKTIGSGGDGRLWSTGETLTIKAYRTAGGSTPILIDNIYFIPVRFQSGAPGGAPDAGDEYTTNTRYLSGALFGDIGATAAYLAAPDDDYAFGGGGGGLSDTQERAGHRDAAMTYSGWCDVSSEIDGFPYSDSLDWDAFHPRHVYALARVKAGAEGYVNAALAGGFISLESDTREIEQAPLYTDSWGIVYLGMHTPGKDSFGHQLTLWLANASMPECDWHNGDLDAAQVETIWFMSSLNDWLHYQTGGRAYLT